MTYFILDHQLEFIGRVGGRGEAAVHHGRVHGVRADDPAGGHLDTGWIRRLGGKRWNLLHRLVYVTALAAVLHYFWKVKLDATNPIYYGIVVIALLAARAWHAIHGTRNQRVEPVLNVVLNHRVEVW